MSATSIRIFLKDGTPQGLRIVEKSNWTGMATVCSRVQFPDVRNRDEFSRPCVYVLLGRSEEDPDRQRIYIGQADVAGDRLYQHHTGPNKKEFWTSLILFTSKDQNINRVHVQYIESRLINLAKASKRAELDNGNVPNPPSLSEADIADAESFLADMLVVYPLLGVNAFEISESIAEASPDIPLLVAQGPGVEAKGRFTPAGFVVYRGSTARAMSVASAPDWMANKRESLKREGVLGQHGDVLVFLQDYTFDTPSGAAVLVLGRSANGYQEWKDANKRTLRAIQDAELRASDPIAQVN